MRSYSSPGSLRRQTTFAAWGSVIAAVVICVLGLIDPPRKQGDVLSWRILLASFTLAAPFLFWNRRVLDTYVEVGEGEISTVRPYSRTTLRWEEITRIEYRPFIKRLKLSSSDGRVVDVDRQLVGYPEIAALIRIRTGHPLPEGALPATLPHPPMTSGAIEICAPLWYKLVSPLLLAAGGYLVIWKRLVDAISAPPRIALLNVCVGLLAASFIVRAARDHWRRSAFRLRLDEQGIHFHSRTERLSCPWSRIASARLEYDDETASFVVRDTANTVVLHLHRTAFNYSGSAMRRFDLLVEEGSRRTRNHSR